MNWNDDVRKPLLNVSKDGYEKSDLRKVSSCPSAETQKKLSFVLESIKKLENARPTKDLSQREIDEGLAEARSLVIVYETRLALCDAQTRAKKKEV